MIRKHLTLAFVASIAIPSLAAQERVVDPRAGIELRRPTLRLTGGAVHRDGL
jgi:hypothetical protein